MTEEILSYTCNCGGTLKKDYTNVEFFGIDFGIKECEVCTKCGSEYLSDEVLDEIEQEVKKRKLFGLEKQAQVTKSGNLVPYIAPISSIENGEIKVPEEWEQDRVYFIF